ncbi:TPA: hypothetical protein O8U24_001842 [Enterobacter kobei]|nr:hypothetical protein [Enterobacter kobei]
MVAGAEIQLSGAVFQYRNRPFHPRSISPYARLERFACLSFLNRLAVSPAIHHNWKRTPPVNKPIPISERGMRFHVVCRSFPDVSSLLPFELIGLTSFNDLSRLHNLVAAVIAAEAPLSRTFKRTVSKW